MHQRQLKNTQLNPVLNKLNEIIFTQKQYCNSQASSNQNSIHEKGNLLLKYQQDQLILQQSNYYQKKRHLNFKKNLTLTKPKAGSQSNIIDNISHPIVNFQPEQLNSSNKFIAPIEQQKQQDQQQQQILLKNIKKKSLIRYKSEGKFPADFFVCITEQQGLSEQKEQKQMQQRIKSDHPTINLIQSHYQATQDASRKCKGSDTLNIIRQLQNNSEIHHKIDAVSMQDLDIKNINNNTNIYNIPLNQQLDEPPKSKGSFILPKIALNHHKADKFKQFFNQNLFMHQNRQLQPSPSWQNIHRRNLTQVSSVQQEDNSFGKKTLGSYQCQVKLKEPISSVKQNNYVSSYDFSFSKNNSLEEDENNNQQQ